MYHVERGQSVSIVIDTTIVSMLYIVLEVKRSKIQSQILVLKLKGDCMTCLRLKWRLVVFAFETTYVAFEGLLAA